MAGQNSVLIGNTRHHQVVVLNKLRPDFIICLSLTSFGFYLYCGNRRVKCKSSSQGRQQAWESIHELLKHLLEMMKESKIPPGNCARKVKVPKVALRKQYYLKFMAEMERKMKEIGKH